MSISMTRTPRTVAGKTRRCLCLIATALTVLTVTAGCGLRASADRSGPTISIDVGNGESVTVHAKQPKVAFFAWTTNSWSQAYTSRVKAQAAKAGFSLDYFDSGGDGEKQFEQIQLAIQRKEYDGFIVIPVDGKLECKLLSEQAPKANVAVVVSVLPLCQRDFNPATPDGQWQPGTLTTVGSENLVAYKVGWLRVAEARLRNARKIGIVAGYPLQSNWLSMSRALSQFPDLTAKIVQVAYTDFTTPQALAQTQTMLQAHPDLDVIISLASDITRGVIQALKAQGKLGKVRVVDIGASAYSISQIKAGNLEFTVPYDPIGNADQAVAALAEAFKGEKVPRFIDDFAASGLGTVNNPLVIDKSNVDSFHPSY